MSGSGRKLRRGSDLAVVLLVLAAFVQLLGLYRTRSESEGDWVAPPIGQLLGLRVSGAGMSAPIEISNLEPGTCRYVVVYSNSCGASATLARQWFQDASMEEGGSVAPAGWRLLWISADTVPPPPSFFPAGFPFPRFYQTEDVDFLDSVGARAVPLHLILDREGRIVSGDIGAALPRADAFGRNCSIVPSGQSEG